MAQRPVGKASIKVEVDGIDQAKQKLDDVKSSAEGVGDSSRRGFGALDDAVGKAGQKIEDSTAGLRKFQGALSGIIGVVGGLGTVAALAFGSIIEKIKETREEAKEFEESLVSIRDKGKEIARSFSDIAKEESDELTKIDEKLARDRKALNDAKIKDLEENLKRQNEIQRQLGDPKLTAGPNAGLDLLSIELEKLKAQQEEANRETERQIQIIEREAEAAKRAIQERIDARETESVAADLTSILEENRLADEAANQQVRDNERRRLEGLKGEERIREELALKTLDLQDQIAKAEEANNPRLAAALRERLAIESEIADTRIQGIRDAEQAENNRRESDALAKEISALKKSIDNQVKTMNENTRTQQQMLRQLVIFLPDIRRVGDGVAGN